VDGGSGRGGQVVLEIKFKRLLSGFSHADGPAQRQEADHLDLKRPLAGVGSQQFELPKLVGGGGESFPFAAEFDGGAWQRQTSGGYCSAAGDSGPCAGHQNEKRTGSQKLATPTYRHISYQLKRWRRRAGSFRPSV
jgi:hypothetical protein